MSSLSKSDVEDIREVFELFDFWDGRDGEVDAFKVGHMCFCLGLNPTQEIISKNGGAAKLGEKGYKLEEFLPIYEKISEDKDSKGSFAEFNECFKTFDREGQGFMSAAELRNVLTGLGEKLTDAEVDELIASTDTREDLEGNIQYANFIEKVLKGPEN